MNTENVWRLRKNQRNQRSGENGRRAQIKPEIKKRHLRNRLKAAAEIIENPVFVKQAQPQGRAEQQRKKLPVAARPAVQAQEKGADGSGVPVI